MKRPLSVIGFTMLVSLISLNLVNSVVFSVAVCGFFALSAVMLIFKRKRRESSFLMTICITAAFSCTFFLTFQYYTYLPAIKLADNNVLIEAEITDFPLVSSGRYHVPAKIKLNNSFGKVKVRLSFPMSSKYDENLEDVIEQLEVGDTVSFVGNIYEIGKGSSEIQQSFKSRKIFLGAYPTKSVTLKKTERKPLTFYILRERQKTIKFLQTSFDSDIASVGVSVLLGDKSFLENEVYSSFRRAGVSHVMAVSGLHLTIWVTFLMSVAAYFGLNKRKLAAFLIAFVFVVMSLALFSGSVTRAGIMLILYLFGFLTKNEADSLNSLGFAAIIILLQNPFASLNIGFLLSFSSAFAIITIASKLMTQAEEAITKKLPDSILSKLLCLASDSIIISFCVSVVTFPLIAIFFGEVSIAGIITNLLFLPVVTPMIIFFGLYVMFPYIPGVSAILKFIAKPLCQYCIKAAEYMASFKYSTITFEKEALPILIAVCFVSVVMLYFSVLRKNKTNTFLSVLLSLLLIGNSFLYNAYIKTVNVKITVYSVSDGLCVSLKSNDELLLLASGCENYYARFIQTDLKKAKSVVITDAQKANMELVSKLNPEKVYIEKEENLLPISLQSKISKENEFNFGKSHIKIENNSIYVEVYGIIITVTDNVTQNADVIITDNTLISGYDEKTNVILSGDDFRQGVITTSENSDITLTISNNSKYKIEGENSWLSLTKKS